MQIEKPMLASPIEDFSKIKYPVIASPKLDGIRALMIDGKLLSRKFKPIPNEYIRRTLEHLLPDGADGEIMIEGTFQDVSSGVMTTTGRPKFTFHWFDWCTNPSTDFSARIQNLADEHVRRYRKKGGVWTVEHPQVIKRKKVIEEAWTEKVQLPNFQDTVVRVQQVLVRNEAELLTLEAKYLHDGYEGIMLRSTNGPYKFGRSTENEGYLLKLKRFVDSEAKITGFEEKMHNNNEAVKDELGHTKRSSHQENLVPMNTLGTLLAKDINTNIDLRIGTGRGLGDELRKQIWDNRDQWLGKTIKYRYQEVGVKDAPRFPIFLGERSEDDFGE